MSNHFNQPTHDDDPRGIVTVLGPGAVGGLLAAMLSRSGEPVRVVARRHAREQLLESGVTVRSKLLGAWTARPRLEPTPEQGSTVLLTVKACGLEYAISLLKEANPNQVVPLLNGVQHVTTLREALPNTHVVPATITVEAQRIGPTTIGHRSPFVRITAPTGIASEGIFKSLTRAGVEVVAGGSETEVLWRKFRFLAPMALLTAFHQQPLGEALDADASLTAQVLGEVAAVSTAVGLPTGQAELEAILRGLPSGMGSSLQTDRKSSSGSTMSTWVKLLSDRTLNPASSAPHPASGFIKA